MVAAKYLEDLVYFNSYWAEIGELALQELNALELDFLLAIDFDLVLRPEDYVTCTCELQSFGDKIGVASGGRTGSARPRQVEVDPWKLVRDTSLLAARAWGWLVPAGGAAMECWMPWNPCADCAVDRLLLTGKARVGSPSSGAARTTGRRSSGGGAGAAPTTCRRMSCAGSFPSSADENDPPTGPGADHSVSPTI